MTDSVKYLRDWAADMRNVSGMSVDADKLDEIANEISDLQARLRIAEKRAEDAEAGAEILDTEGMDANDKLCKLAALILQCDMGTPQGQRAKDYARYCLKMIEHDPEAAR
jgi:hypothetical protein